MPAGRPSLYNDALAIDICDRLAHGESLRTICKDDHMPTDRAVLRWLFDGKHTNFVQQYARAREAQADYYAAEIIEIGDEITVEATYQGAAVLLDISNAAVSRNRLRVDARKWYASKLAPKKYGDRIELAGEITHALRPLAALTDSELMAERQRIQISG